MTPPRRSRQVRKLLPHFLTKLADILIYYLNDELSKSQNLKEKFPYVSYNRIYYIARSRNDAAAVCILSPPKQTNDFLTVFKYNIIFLRCCEHSRFLEHFRNSFLNAFK